MATVYLAVLGVQRFLREIAISAGLHHPHGAQDASRLHPQSPGGEH